MSKKSKRRKRRKLSSSSDEEEEKAYKDKDVINSCNFVKRKQDVKRRESSTAKQRHLVSSTPKDDSQSTRQIKRPVYRFKKKQETEQKSHNKDDNSTKAKSVSTPSHGGNCSTKAKHDISGKHDPVSGSRTEERGTHKPLSSTSTSSQRTERTSKVSPDKKLSERSSSKLHKQLKIPSLVSADHKKSQNVEKKKCRTEEPLRTGHDSNTVKSASETSSTPKDSSKQKSSESVKKCPSKQKECETKRKLCSEAEICFASSTKQSSTFVKDTTSENSLKVLKNVTPVSESVKSVLLTPPKLSSSQLQILPLTPRLPLKFKISKKLQQSPVASTSSNNEATPIKSNLKHETKRSDSGDSVRSPMQENVQQPQSCLDVATSFLCEGQGRRSCQLPAVCDTTTEPWCDQMQVVEELHLARTEKRLGVNVMQSYGELTCMDIDPPEEKVGDTQCRQPPQQDLILVLDTNILLSHLDYVKKIRSLGLGAVGFPLILIPWVVLQELDSLKRGRHFSGSVAHLATPAISFICTSLKSREPNLWGQSLQQAAEASDGLNAENNDDRVLQCCLQYQSLYPGCALILCTNDKNLCSKAILSGVKALSKNDLEAEVCRSKPDLLQNLQTPMLPDTNPQISPSVLNRSKQSPDRKGLAPGLVEKDKKTKQDLSRCTSELENCLQNVLSDVLEVEMKAAYDDLWLEIVYLKPPWTLRDVLQCLKKHWIAVFGHIVPRRKQQTVLNLIDFFSSGKTVDTCSVLVALQEAKELVEAFRSSSSHVPSAISVMDNIYNELQPQGDSPADDVVMKDDDEDKQPMSAQVSHQDVWTLFENIWSNVYQISLELFKALSFDPHTMQTAAPVRGPPPPQDALAFLHKLSSTVSQLLQAFSSVLSSGPELEVVQTLLTVIHSNKIVIVDSRLTSKHLLDCFSQQEYREKLRVGGTQLMGLKEALDRCVWAAGQLCGPESGRMPD